MMVISRILAAGAIALGGTVAHATTMTLEFQGATTGSMRNTARVTEAPAPGFGRMPQMNVFAGGLDYLDATGDMGMLTSWCLDLRRCGAGSGGIFAEFEPRFSAAASIQTLFDANYLDLDTSDLVQSAAFQLAVWEALFDGSELDLETGRFAAHGHAFWAGAGASSAITAQAAIYLSRAASYDGGLVWDLMFLQSQQSGSGLVTANLTAVPLPASGLLLIGAGGTLLALRRRKQT